MEKKKMKAAQQQLNDIQDDQEQILTCKARDHGWQGHIVCLENSKEGRLCEFCIPFGFETMCNNPLRIAQIRNDGT
jgi:hypothetical protein